MSVLLYCGGPFERTAEPLMLACMTAGVDYLDITAEIAVYRLAERLGANAATAGVMLLPGIGWDVVPTDCLAAQVAHRMWTAGASDHTSGRGFDVTRIGVQRG